nr:MAG TPA_asm: hypothetical protein [Caudoviricetes sp.]
MLPPSSPLAAFPSFAARGVSYSQGDGCGKTQKK